MSKQANLYKDHRSLYVKRVRETVENSWNDDDDERRKRRTRMKLKMRTMMMII